MNIIEKLVKRIISRHAWKEFIKETVEKQKTCAGCQKGGTVKSKE